MDDALLLLTRELAVQFQVPFWFTRVVWGVFVRFDEDWIRSYLVLGGVSDVELVLPEYLKGKLSLDEWRALIALHLVRVRSITTGGRIGGFLRKFALADRRLFFFLLFLMPAFFATSYTRSTTGLVLVTILPSPIFLIAALWLRRSLRKSLRTREFALDKTVADQYGVVQVSQVLEKMEVLKREAMPNLGSIYARLYYQSRFSNYYNPSVTERIQELNNPNITGLPRPSLVPRIGIRGRVVLLLVGLGIFWAPTFVASSLYLHGQSNIVCMDNTCAALVVIAVVGFWMAVISGISIVIWFVRRFL